VCAYSWLSRPCGCTWYRCLFVKGLRTADIPALFLTLCRCSKGLKYVPDFVPLSTGYNSCTGGTHAQNTAEWCNTLCWQVRSHNVIRCKGSPPCKHQPSIVQACIIHSGVRHSLQTQQVLGSPGWRCACGCSQARLCPSARLLKWATPRFTQPPTQVGNSLAFSSNDSPCRERRRAKWM
jgi:hypothetical protein